MINYCESPETWQQSIGADGSCVALGSGMCSS